MSNVTIYQVFPSLMRFSNQTTACATLASAAGWWLYNRMITDPLRILYFIGPWWNNAPMSEICFQLTNVKSEWWEAEPSRMIECESLAERQFQSWDATVMVCLWFSFLLFVVFQLFCHCFVIRPLVNSFKRRNE